MQAVRTSCSLVVRSNVFRQRMFSSAPHRSALVTGGSQGLGKVISKKLAADGYKVAICDLLISEGKSVAEDLDGIFIHADVTKPKDVEDAVAKVVKTYGSLDALVNNAGVVCAQVPMGDVDVEEWNRVIDVNLNGAFFALKFSLAQMAKQTTGGSIVSISSIAGFRGMNNLSPYTAAKWAIRGLTQEAAVEYCEKNIRVNAVAPTTVETSMVAEFIRASDDPEVMKEFVTSMNALPGCPHPDDVANAVAFLLSDEARYITGHTLPVDAGALARLPNRREMFNVK